MVWRGSRILAKGQPGKCMYSKTDHFHASDFCGLCELWFVLFVSNSQILDSLHRPTSKRNMCVRPLGVFWFTHLLLWEREVQKEMFCENYRFYSRLVFYPLLLMKMEPGRVKRLHIEIPAGWLYRSHIPVPVPLAVAMVSWRTSKGTLHQLHA